MKFTLSSNVLEEMLKYAKEKDEKPCPTYFLRVVGVEKNLRRYWLTLEEESGKEIWAMVSLLLTERISIQQLITKPIIKLEHYYIHQFEAAKFIDNPIVTYIHVIGISRMQILVGKALTTEMEIQNNMGKPQKLPRPKRKKRKPESELESSEDDSQPEEKERESPEPKTKLNSVVTVKEILQPSENKSPNIQPTNIISKPLDENGKTATLISSLTLTRNSPFLRMCVEMCGAITVSVQGCVYRWCRFKDSSGEVSCVMFEPICTSINNFLKVGAIIEIENAIVEKNFPTMSTGNQQYKLLINRSTIVALYNDNTCVYENPPNPNLVILPIIDNSTVKYPSLESVKISSQSAHRANAIGVMMWMSKMLDVKHDNRLVKCRNLQIKDESGSALVSMWEMTAEKNYFPIGSIVSVKRARMKMYCGDLELVIDDKATISLAEDCEEKTRLKGWYKPPPGTISKKKKKRKRSYFF